jgi:dTDP-4-dehydrorhamnose 3,5-epimerase
MKITETEISGVLIIEENIYNDLRGSFMETWHYSWGAYDWIQDNQSKSIYGVVRGLHAQQEPFAQTKLVRVAAGTIYDVAVDMRKNSPTYMKHVGVFLFGNRQLLIPRGFLHGFSVQTYEAIVCYKVDNFYDKKSEWGVRYDDPSLNIDWQLPQAKIIISEKDASWGKII